MNKDLEFNINKVNELYQRTLTHNDLSKEDLDMQAKCREDLLKYFNAVMYNNIENGIN